MGVGQVRFREKRGNVQVNGSDSFSPSPWLVFWKMALADRPHCLGQVLAVEGEPHVIDQSTLGFSQQFTRTPYFKVPPERLPHESS